MRPLRNIPQSSPSFWVPASIAGIAVALRTFACLRMIEPPSLLRGDPEFYLKITQGLLERRWAPDVWIFPPGYPLLALPFATLIGAGWGVIVVSALCGIALPLLLLAIARRAANPSRAAWAALVVAVYPEAVYSTARALSEAPALVSIAAMIVLFEASERASTERGRRMFASAAGAAGGISALARPETAICLPLLASFAMAFPGRKIHRQSRESSLLFLAIAVIVMAPYVLALHERSGVWGLSLKAHFNVQKTLVQQQGSTFLERRSIWDEYVQKHFLRDGVLDPRLVAQEIDLKKYVFSRQFFPLYWENLSYAFGRRAPLENLFAALGTFGLIAAARGGNRSRREAALAAISGAPFLAVPVLFPPIERYGLVALPAFAWGTGVLLEWCTARIGARFGARAVAAALGAIVTIIVIPASIAVEKSTRDAHWAGRKYEFHVAMFTGELDRAEALVGEGLQVDPKNPAIRIAVGDLQARRGDVAGALSSYDESLRRGGDRVMIAFALGKMGKLDLADRALEPLRRAPPNNVEYWTVEGHLAAARGNARAAIAAYDRAEQAGGDPATLAAARAQAQLQVKSGNPDSSARSNVPDRP